MVETLRAEWQPFRLPAAVPSGPKWVAVPVHPVVAPCGPEGAVALDPAGVWTWRCFGGQRRGGAAAVVGFPDGASEGAADRFSERGGRGIAAEFANASPPYKIMGDMTNYSYRQMEVDYQ